MLAVVTRLDVPDQARAAIWDHLERTARSLVGAPPPQQQDRFSRSSRRPHGRPR